MLPSFCINDRKPQRGHLHSRSVNQTGKLQGAYSHHSRLKTIYTAVIALLSSSLHAEQPGPFLPSILIEDIVVSDISEYAQLITDINERMRTKHQVPLFLRGYESWTLNGKGEDAFQLIPAASFADIQQNEEIFSTHPGFSRSRHELGSIAKSQNRFYLKAIRFDGTNSPGWLINTFVDSNSESGLLESLSEVESLLLRQGIETPKINVFRAIAGHSGFSHLVSINLGSADQLGKALDALALEPWSWNRPGESNQNGSIVKSSVYRELSPQ